MKNKIISILIFNFILFTSVAQNIQVSTIGTPQSFADMLTDGCLEISNVSYTGAANAIGSFTNGEALGIAEGVIMSTGNVADAVGPNSSTNTGTAHGLPGDPTYDAQFGVVSSDAAVLEFDFIPHSYQVTFSFIFASEAYPELNGLGIDEGFGIFINGPGGLNGTAYIDSTVAVVPFSQSPVNVNTINSTTNAMYYVDNIGGQNLEYDGYSTAFFKTFFTTPCQTYHMKIVIADVHPLFDSAVLIGAESIKSDFLLLVNNYSNSGGLDDISESCTNNIIIQRLNQLDTLAFPFDITVSGTSTAGVDFTGISTGQYEIPLSESFISIPYTAILDTMTEGIETIVFTFTHPSFCDTTCIGSFELEIDIIDNYPLVAGIVQSDTGICSVNTTYFTIETFIPPNMDPSTVFYSWSTGGAESFIVAEPSAGLQNEYCVTITDICDQMVVDCITITNSDFTSIQLDPTDNLCYGEENGEIIVSGTGGFLPYTYTWDPAGIGNDSVNTIENLASGYYNVTVTDTIGCSFDSGFLIDSPDSIYYSLAIFEPKCHDGTDGSVSFQMFEGVPPYSFEWSNGETSAGLDSVPAGNYFITATDTHGCTLELPVIIDQPDELVLTASSDAFICLGQTLPLSAYAVGGTPNYYYTWSDGASGPNTSVTPSVSTIYTVQVFDINGCESNVESISVNIYPAISVQLYTTDDSLCVGDETSIYADIQGGTGGPYLAIFSNGASSDILPPPYVVSPTITTDYHVVIEDFCGSPTGINSLTVSVFEPPEVLIDADKYEGCKPLTINFEDLNYEDGNEYHWNYNDGTNEILSYTAFPTHTFINDGLYDITLDVTSKVGCKNTVTSEEFIYVFPNPTARFHSNPEIASIIKPIIFFENESDDAFISSWDFGDGTDISNSESPEHNYNAVGQYNITLNIENEFGCIDEFTQTILIRNEYTFYVPNAISPGSAFAVNRLFKPYGEGIDPNNFHMIIYNRWGNKIYETFDLNHPWNGEVNGKQSELGASFPWVIIYKDINGEQHQESGTVTIVE